MQRSKAGRFIDPLYLLKITPASHFYAQKPSIPEYFDSLYQARECLDLLLKWTANTVKTGRFSAGQLPQKSEAWLQQWLGSLEKFKDARKLSIKDLCNWQVLRATGKILFVMIRTMNADDEMIFDRYEDDYREFTSAASQFVAYGRQWSRENVCFGIDSGFSCLVGWVAQRWCRDPTLRDQLIDVLFAAKRRESVDNAETWARICQRIKMEEEAGICPRSCHDIAREKRIRIHEGRFYWANNVLCITVLRPPYDETQRQDLWISPLHRVGEGRQEQEAAEVMKDTEPNVVVGNGFISFMVLGHYYTVKASRFIFPIPRM